MSTLRDQLRALPSFPDELPVLDPAAAPQDPLRLFLDWLAEAIATGERQPSAMTLTTIDDRQRPAQRTLIIKDVDDRGLHFASSRSSRKGQHLAARPYAGMLFFWRALGRQVEISGDVEPLSAEESARDWRERPSSGGADNPDWQVWALRPSRFEFLQATHDRRHVRLEYLLADGGWRSERLVASESVTSGGDDSR